MSGAHPWNTVENLKVYQLSGSCTEMLYWRKVKCMEPFVGKLRQDMWPHLWGKRWLMLRLSGEDELEYCI